MADVAEAVPNGTANLEKLIETGTEMKEEIKSGAKEMENDSKDDENVQKMDIDETEAKESKEQKEREEKDSMEGEEKEEAESEPMEEESGAQVDGQMEDRVDGSREEKENPEVGKEEIVSKKHAKAKVAGKRSSNKKKEVKEKKEERKTPPPSAIERPVRERKSVERLVASIEKETIREFHIEKGRGTALKDIPNVAYKLSKRKTDDTFKMLHTILFGRRGKAAQFKANISRFSGFVWHENEDKQKLKVKEKFDKCVKEKLLDFCDILDIPVGKATTKKEDIVTKLIDFLVAPHATKSESLAEKEQSSKGIKRKRVDKGTASTSGSTASKRLSKSRPRTGYATKREGKKGTFEMEDELDGEEKEEEREEEKVNSASESSEDEMPKHDKVQQKENVSEDESEENREKQKGQSSNKLTKKESSGNTRMKKVNAGIKKIMTPKKSSPKPKINSKKFPSSHLSVDDNSGTSPKMFSRKKKDEVVAKEKPTSKKFAPKEKSVKKLFKGKDKTKEEKLKPNDEELRNAICEILKEVDFNMATFTDILKQLAGQFNTDLMPRKSSIKLMIQDELTKLADEADDEEDDGDAGKDGK